MSSIAVQKLRRLIAERSARAVARDVGVSRPQLARHAGGALPSALLRARYVTIGIQAHEWGDGPSAKAAPTTKAAPSPSTSPTGDRSDRSELTLSLDQAVALFRRANTSHTDRIKAANVACSALAARSLPRYSIADFVEFGDLKNTLFKTLEPHAEAFEAIRSIFEDLDSRVAARDSYAEPLQEIIHFVDCFLADSETSTRDRAAAVAVRTRASKLLERASADPLEVRDASEFRSRVLSVLARFPEALTDVVRVFGDPSAALTTPTTAARPNLSNLARRFFALRDAGDVGEAERARLEAERAVQNRRPVVDAPRGAVAPACFNSNWPGYLAECERQGWITRR